MTDITQAPQRPHTLARRVTLAAALYLAGAVALTWAWNTILPDLAQLPAVRFAEGAAVALALVLAGALLELGRGLVR